MVFAKQKRLPAGQLEPKLYTQQLAIKEKWEMMEEETTRSVDKGRHLEGAEEDSDFDIDSLYDEVSKRLKE